MKRYHQWQIVNHVAMIIALAAYLGGFWFKAGAFVGSAIFLVTTAVTLVSEIRKFNIARQAYAYLDAELDKAEEGVTEGVG